MFHVKLSIGLCSAGLRGANRPPRRPRIDDPPDHTTVARKTRVVSGVTPRPSSMIPTWESLALRTAAAAAASSSAARAPFMKSISPPDRSNGAVSGINRRSAVTALAVTWSRSAGTMASSARDRMTDTFPSPNRRLSSRSHSTLRSIGSMRTNCTSGRAMANTIPGSPAPLPTSPTNPGLSRGATSAQLRMWRDQSRGSSSGPINPRISPCSASCRVKSRASSSCGPNRSAAPGGSGSKSPIST